MKGLAKVRDLILPKLNNFSSIDLIHSDGYCFCSAMSYFSDNFTVKHFQKRLKNPNQSRLNRS